MSEYWCQSCKTFPLMLYILTSVWVLQTTNPGQKYASSMFFCAKKVEKEEKARQLKEHVFRGKICFRY